MLGRVLSRLSPLRRSAASLSCLAARLPASSSHSSQLLPARLPGLQSRPLASKPIDGTGDADYGRELDPAQYEEVSEETLESLCEALEALPDFIDVAQDFDVTYSQGVLTAGLGGGLGTYVINKQAPNRQIWLSSPVSGPKRYDYLHGRWLYGREDATLHQLLEAELRQLFPDDADKVDLADCAHSGQE